MLWLIQLIVEQVSLLFTQSNLNLLFAVLCFAASRGLCPKLTMLLSALLYIALAFCPS